MFMSISSSMLIIWFQKNVSDNQFDAKIPTINFFMCSAE